MTGPTDRPVVVGVGGDAASQEAVGLAVVEARARQRPLRVVCAYEPPLPMDTEPGVFGEPGFGFGGAGALALDLDTMDVDQLERDLERDVVAPVVAHARDQLGHDRVSGVVRTGRPAAVIVDECTSVRAELVVVGARPRSVFASAVLGSVCSAVATHAPCPVVVARAPVEPTGAERSTTAVLRRRVVVGVDGSEGSAQAAAFAFEEAAYRQAPLVAVHCWRVEHPGAASWHADRVADQRKQRQRALSDRIAGLSSSHPDVAVTTTVVEGRAAVLLTELSRDAGLVVVGSRGRGGLPGLLLGSVSQSLLHHAYCSVAVVRSGRG